jgi:glycine cleavage system regulatory protein
MAHLVLTVAGSDRAGLVQALADVIAAHGGNWERSELAELAGTFAGVVLVEVPDAQRAALTGALGDLAGLLTVTEYPGVETPAVAPAEHVTFTVLGNDRPGIVRDITHALVGRGLTIDRLTSRTTATPMAGGELFEATVTAHAAAGADIAAAVAALEQLAAEIQVDLTVA